MPNVTEKMRPKGGRWVNARVAALLLLDAGGTNDVDRCYAHRLACQTMPGTTKAICGLQFARRLNAVAVIRGKRYGEEFTREVVERLQRRCNRTPAAQAAAIRAGEKGGVSKRRPVSQDWGSSNPNKPRHVGRSRDRRQANRRRF